MHVCVYVYVCMYVCKSPYSGTTLYRMSNG